MFRRASVAMKLDKAKSTPPPRRATATGAPLSEHPSKKAAGSQDQHGLEDRTDDVLMGGALTAEDLFELLDMEIDNLSERCKSAEGVAKNDLRPLVKAIADLRAVGMGQEDRVKRAVEFQMRCTQQLVLQQEIKAALQSKSMAEIQACLEKVKLYQLQKLNVAKRLELEWGAMQKEIKKETAEELRRVQAENKQLQKEIASSATSTQSSPSSQGAPAKRKSLLPAFGGVFRRAESSPGPDRQSHADEFALEDEDYAAMTIKDLRAMCVEHGVDATGVLEKRDLVRLVSAKIAQKPLQPAPAKPAPKLALPIAMPGGA
jgi:hypothetical protein